MDKLLIILVVLFANNATSQGFKVDFDDVSYVRNYDGDTINFDIAEGLTMQIIKSLSEYMNNEDTDVIQDLLEDKLAVIPNQIRLNNIDTAEMRPRKKRNQTAESKALFDCEKLVAKKAQKFVEISLKNASVIHLRSCSKGKYYRMVCDVFYDDKNLALELLTLKYGYEYTGGKKAYYNWCAVN
jgi:endonuclease YncB( thermonuclease family)